VLGTGLLLSLATTAAAGVIVVDPGGGNGAAALQAALAGAADGDIVLVRAGIYTSFASPSYYTIAGKGLTLTTDAATPPVLGPLEVEQVPAGSTAFVRGLVLGQSAVPTMLGSAAPGLDAHDNAGTVWIEDCTLAGMDGNGLLFIGNSSGAPGASLSNCAGVVLQRCSLTGGRGANYSSVTGIKYYATNAGDALRATGESRVTARECSFQGGVGGSGQTISPGIESASGGDGAFLQHATIDLADCTLTGGSNGSGNLTTFDQAGNGLTLEWATATQRGCSFTGAALVPAGVPSLPVWPGLEFVTDYPSSARGFAISSPLQEGQVGSFEVDGEPGDVVTLLLALEAGFAPLASKQGVLTLSPLPALLLVPLGPTDGSGQLSGGFTAPPLPAALMGATLPLQIVVQNSGTTTLEGSSAFVWLDASL
jgi:hypothetical protein